MWSCCPDCVRKSVVKCARKHSSIFKVLQLLRDCCMSNTQNYMHIICICIVLINMQKATTYAFFSRVVFSGSGSCTWLQWVAPGTQLVGAGAAWHKGCFCAAAGVLRCRHCLQTHSRKKERGPSRFPGKLAAPGAAFVIFLCSLTAAVMHRYNVPVAALVFGSIRKIWTREGQ